MRRAISPLLVANRGEIALRVMRTARSLGLATVAVYSDADAQAPFVRFADAAVAIGPGPAPESYLRIEAILEAAEASGARAIHPGYGFLSENTAFARAAEAAGLVFVGPPADAIEAMGDKARAKRRMMEAGVPCVPGYEGEDQAAKAFTAAAARIGFPVMVKAAAGGGGRGMRLVERAGDLAAALKTARSEAEQAFGDGTLILERALVDARHVEIQVFADNAGRTIHLGERDCSVQRRHQKVIEEAPCPVMTSALRAAMGAAAVEAARAVGYVGAGTVEFLLDAAGAFYFLEMNTRLQVEHPVTEMITGLDLVALQLRVAAGEPLPLAQEDVRLKGHAIEARLYAEDPAAGFLPSAGPVQLLRLPEGEGVRVDAGVESGGSVSPFYDPMIAKVIAHGDTREEARQRLVRALSGAAIFGPSANRDFLIDALERPVFARGEATTAFLAETYGEAGFKPAATTPPLLAAAAAVAHIAAQRRAFEEALDVDGELLDWASAGALATIFDFEADGVRTKVSLRPLGAQRYKALIADAAHEVIVRSFATPTARLTVDGAALELTFLADAGAVSIATPTRTFTLVDHAARIAAKADAPAAGQLRAPMHGRLVELLVSEGESVEAGQRVAVLEAMKMQHSLAAGIAGRISRIAGAAGAQIAAGDLILDIEPAGDAP
jgi:geranyl-CoA carboxylase alpha subunit